MENFEFCTPTRVFFGKGEERKIGSIIEEYGFKKVLVHFGGGSVKKIGLLDIVFEELKAHHIDYVELGGVEPNPLLSMVRTGIALCQKEHVDLILAVGGGSVLDSAKAIADGYANPEVDPWDLITQKVKFSKSTPVATILTISASGSEMSNSCVISNEATGEKRGYMTPLHRPLFSILNPEWTYTVSPYQTACGITDIMMHTLERYFCVNEHNDFVDRLGESVLISVIEAGRVAMKDPNNYEARATLMWAGSISHNGLTGTGKNFVMRVHQMEHILSGFDHSIAHGAGLAALWASWARYVLPKAVPQFAQYANRVWQVPMNEETPIETALEGIRLTEEFFHELGMPISLRELNIQEKDLEMFAEEVTFHGKRVLNDYVVLDKAELYDIFKAAY